MDLNRLLETVHYLPHHVRMAYFEALTEAERVPLRIEVDQELVGTEDHDNELVDDLRKLRIAISGPGR